MAPLTQAEVDGIVAELKPHLASDQTKTVLGVGAYTVMFGDHPEFVPLFSKLKGLSGDAVFKSEGIKHYGMTLVNDLVVLLVAASDDGKMKAAVDKSGHDHISRNVTPVQFKEGLPSFIKFFDATLSKAENKAAMKKFLEHIFPLIAGGINK